MKNLLDIRITHPEKKKPVRIATDEMVEQIVAEYKAGGTTYEKLAEKYGVSRSSVSDYVRGQRRSKKTNE